jgi:hypothetical protein
MRKKKAWPFWFLLILTVAVLAVENFGSFSLSVPGLLRSSDGLPILDMRLWYTAADAYQLFEKLGPAGRSDLWHLYLTLDILIPILLTAFLWSALSRGAFSRLRAVALFGGTFDYLENISVLILLMNYPTHIDRLVTVAACFTVLKFVSYISIAILAIVGYAIKFFRGDSTLDAAAG